MTSFRSITPHVAVLLGLCLGAPAGALASPLLSGYGGPGAGSQVILGSALVNGPRGGGGPTAAATSARGDSAPTRVTSARGTPARGSEAHRSGTVSGSAAREAPVSVQGRTVSHSEALGLSSRDLALIIVVACALVVIGFMTGRLARAPWREGPAA
ncbi:MAG: hypothetical protein E6G34_08530 [Actinobacteria bacterium]|nr:MAG: hypothetical protein E6G34_08530 [Actinomycetota bacterium]